MTLSGATEYFTHIANVKFLKSNVDHSVGFPKIYLHRSARRRRGAARRWQSPVDCWWSGEAFPARGSLPPAEAGAGLAGRRAAVSWLGRVARAPLRGRHELGVRGHVALVEEPAAFFFFTAAQSVLEYKELEFSNCEECIGDMD